jgi:DNA-binding response OmpR family regulator
MARVLIVDDDADGSEAVARFVERAGHQVLRAPDGRKALAALATGAPDVVVLDVMMPRMDGIRFLRVLHGYTRGSFVPVILLTALGEGLETQQASDLGVKRIFRKAHYQLSDLLDCINQHARLDPPAHSGVSLLVP